MKVNKSQLEDILSVSHVTLTEWQEQGLPIEVRATRKGQSHTYDTAAVIAWMVQRELDKHGIELPRDRLARLQGDEAEMRLLERRGLLIPVEQIEPAWMAMVTAARSYLRSEPERLAHLLDAMDGIDSKRDMLAETFDEFLRKLSNFDMEDEAGPDDGPAPAHARGVPEAGAATPHVGGGLG